VCFLDPNVHHIPVKLFVKVQMVKIWSIVDGWVPLHNAILVTVMFAKLDITYTKMVLRVWHVSRTVVTALLTDVQTVRKAIGCARTGPCALNAMINVQIVETL